ncbi:MAG TPA: gfo/Idh/MocA family oxidoreductase [Verrucomicrobia bacterium]|nr:gfo/Idh/MocA family oxidoreductase [Verrucomicrobiota bacterium]
MKRIGVLGFGRRINSVLKNLMSVADGNVSVVAFYDNSAKAVERISAEYPGIRVCSSVEELVTSPDVDWVFIGSFNAAHCGHAVAALDAGKDVFCEKPVATNRQQCQDIVAARQRHPDQQFVVGFVLRYSAFYRTMKRWIDEGRLGRLISMEFNETLSPFHGAAMHGNWRRRSEWSGPMILEKCCHDIDLLLWMTGSKPSRVASFGGLNFFTSANAHHNDLYPVGPKGFRYYDRGLATGFAVGTEHNITPFNDDKDTIDNQVSILELENGARVSFHFCMHSAKLERRFYMCGTRGSIRADVLTGTLEYTPVGWEPTSETVRPIEGDDHGNAELPMVQDVLACMLHGAPPPTTLEDGLRASYTCFGIDEARENGAVVDMAGYWADIKR